MEDQEIWRDIPGYEGYYQVSNLNRARSLDRVVKRKFNYGVEGEMPYKGQLLKIGIFNTTGYSRINLKKDGKAKTVMFSRVVWEAFNGPIPEGMEVNHIDENITNNCLSNLNLLTPKENCNWKSRNKRISDKNSGVKKGPMSQEHKDKISEGLRKSEKAIESHLRRRNNDNSKPVIQYDLDGNYIDDYPSLGEVERVTGFCGRYISAAASGKRRQAKGFIWKFKEGL